jgi:hypothetical protein
MPVELCSIAVDASLLYTMQLQSATCTKRSRILVLDEAIIASDGDLPLQVVLLSEVS